MTREYPVSLEFEIPADVRLGFLRYDRPGSVGGDIGDVRWTNLDWADDARTRVRTVDAELLTGLPGLTDAEAHDIATQIVKEYVHAVGWRDL